MNLLDHRRVPGHEECGGALDDHVEVSGHLDTQDHQESLQSTVSSQGSHDFSFSLYGLVQNWNFKLSILNLHAPRTSTGHHRRALPRVVAARDRRAGSRRVCVVVDLAPQSRTRVCPREGRSLFRGRAVFVRSDPDVVQPERGHSVHAPRLCVCTDHRLRGDKRQVWVASVGDLVPNRTARCSGDLVGGHRLVSRALVVLVRDTITRDSGVYLGMRETDIPTKSQRVRGHMSCGRTSIKKYFTKYCFFNVLFLAFAKL